MYRTGFIGASTQEVTEWVGERVGDAKTICVPFAGSGRDIASMAGTDRTISSWDTQLYSSMIINGVFRAKSVETNVDGIHYRKGYMYETKALKYIDDRCAGFIDWVSAEGTDYDKACLASAVVRSTLMGRMTQWYANIEQLWTRFNRARAANEEFIGLPGNFDHTYGSFFDSIPNQHFDLMQVDPPKVVVGSDVYSAYFNTLHRVLGGQEDLPKWNWRNVLSSFRQIMEVDTDCVLFHYTSGVRPPNEEVMRLLAEYGTIEEERAFDHRGRSDYAVVVRKKDA